MKIRSFFQSMRRPTIGSVPLAILVAFYLLCAFNHSFWRRLYEAFHYDYVMIGAVMLVLGCLFMMMTVVFSVKYLEKPFLIVLIFAGSIGSWFTDQFGTIIDSDMIANAMITTHAEAANLITPSFIIHVFVTALLPCLLIAFVRIRHRHFVAKVGYNLMVIVPCLIVAVVTTIAISRTMFSTFRENQILAKIIEPIVPLKSAVSYALNQRQKGPIIVSPLGLDAKVEPLQTDKRPRVSIVVVGETARADNFSLNGYVKETNPELKKRDMIYFANTSSCGTATAYSVPCMFSAYHRADFSKKKASQNENLLDVLSHAGLQVEWWENNTGSQGVAERAKVVNFYGGNDPEFCIDGECQDGIMLKPLLTWLDNVKEDSVLVIHQLGSHGPAYYKRYPEAFRKFQPDCRGLEFSKCSNEEIVNAYDNSILYTDYFLATIIDALKAHADELDGAMLYMSDHGESLGENGLYLHGAPYMLAPTTQTHIPFVLWMTDGFAKNMALDRNCLRKDAAFEPLSHDYLFNAVLDMMNVKTTSRKAESELFSACKMSYTAGK